MRAGPGPWTVRLLFLFLSVVWGLNFLFIRIGLDDASPLWLALLRAAVGAAATAVMLVPLHTWRELDARGRRDALLLGIPNTTLFYAFLFAALESVLPGVAAVLTYTFPLWVAVLSPFVLGHRLTIKHWGAVAGGFLGVVLIAHAWTVFTSGVSALAVLELLGAALSWALGTVLFQRRFRREEMLEANAFQLFGGTAGLAVLVVAFTPVPLPTWTGPLAATLLWTGVLGTTLAYSIWFWLLGRTRAATLSAYVFLVPVVALGASALFFGERLDVEQLGGVFLVLLSIYGIARAPSGPVSPDEAEPSPAE